MRGCYSLSLLYEMLFSHNRPNLRGEKGAKIYQKYINVVDDKGLFRFNVLQEIL